MLPATGGEMRPLTTDPTPDWNPRWSPDGTQIAFYAYRSGNRDVWVVPARGGPARQITVHPAADSNPQWSAIDGSELVFQSQRDGDTALWVVSATGEHPRRLPNGTLDRSLDGESLLVRRDGALSVERTGGGAPVRLSTADHQPTGLHFADGGKSILYSVIAGPRDHHDVWRLSVAEGALTRLTRLEGQRGRLGYDFAADARYLYFTWYEDEGDIWVMEVARPGAR